MSPVAAPAARPAPSPAPPELLWRLTVPEYEEMVAKGILGEDDPVELLEGLLVAKMSKSWGHVACQSLLIAHLVPHLRGWFLQAQDPIRVGESMPEPDVAVVRGAVGDYRRVPEAADVGLIVEIADSSLVRDRGWKQRIYAAGGIPVYWVVNLAEESVEVHSEPSGPGEAPAYRRLEMLRREATLPLMLEGVEAARIPVADLLPPPTGRR